MRSSARYYKPMATITKALYSFNYMERTALTAGLDEAQVEEEIEDLGIGEFRAAQYHFLRRLTTLIQQNIQPEHDGASWRQFL